MTVTTAIRKPKPKLARGAGGSMPDLIAGLAEKGRLSHRQKIAAARHIKDLEKANGRSGSLSNWVMERVQTSRRHNSPNIRWTEADVACQYVWDRLSETEMAIYRWLVLNSELERRSFADLGRQRASYASVDAATGYAVGLVAALLDRIADIHDDMDQSRRTVLRFPIRKRSNPP